MILYTISKGGEREKGRMGRGEERELAKKERRKENERGTIESVFREAREYIG